MGENLAGQSSNGGRTVARREFDVDQTDPIVSVIETVAELEGRDSTDLPPLYSSIGDLVNELFSNQSTDGPPTEVEFSYEGYRVTLTQDGDATFRKSMTVA